MCNKKHDDWQNFLFFYSKDTFLHFLTALKCISMKQSKRHSREQAPGQCGLAIVILKRCHGRFAKLDLWKCELVPYVSNVASLMMAMRVSSRQTSKVHIKQKGLIIKHFVSLLEMLCCSLIIDIDIKHEKTEAKRNDIKQVPSAP